MDFGKPSIGIAMNLHTFCDMNTYTLYGRLKFKPNKNKYSTQVLLLTKTFEVFPPATFPVHPTCDTTLCNTGFMFFFLKIKFRVAFFFEFCEGIPIYLLYRAPSLS